MKLAIIRKDCSFRKGGAERYAANLCRELAETGHEVHVLAENCDADIHPSLVHLPIQVNRATSWSRNNSFHRNAQAALPDVGADAVLALSRSWPADAFRVSDPLHRFWMEVRYPGKLHRAIQRLNPRHRAILQLENDIFDPAHTRMIVTNSRLSKTLIGRYFPRYPQERVHVVYNGVDLERFSPGESAPAGGRARLLFVGQDFRRKGLGPLIEALAALKNRGVDCELRVIGRDKPAPYRAQARRLGVGDRVTFEGPTREIHDAYRAADLLVFPTLYDPFANVCLEALACGLAVLTTTTNGASEIIDEGVNGYVIPGEESSLAGEIAARVATFMKTADRPAMRRAAREKAERFTIRGNSERIVELLRQP